MRTFLILSMLFLYIPNAVASDWGDIKTIIRQKLKDTGPTSGEYYYTDADLLLKGNFVQRNICFRSDAMRRYFYINVTTGTRTYVISSSIQKIYFVYFEDISSTSTYKRLDYTTIKVLDKDYSNWESFDSGEPLEWYQVFISTWSTSELRIGLKPAPSSEYSSSGTYYYKIRIDASEEPADMTSDTDIPFNGNTRMYAMHEAIVYGVLALCRDDSSSETKYRELIDIMSANFREMPAREGGITPRRR